MATDVTQVWSRSDGPPETHRHAVTAFVYACLGWFTPLFGAVLALIYAGRARRAVDAAPERYRGRQLAGSAASMAKAQLLLLLVGIVLAVLVAGLFAEQARRSIDDLGSADVAVATTAPTLAAEPEPEPTPAEEEAPPAEVADPRESDPLITRATFAAACSNGYGGTDNRGPCECTYDELRDQGYSDRRLYDLAQSIIDVTGISDQVARVIEGCGASTD